LYWRPQFVQVVRQLCDFRGGDLLRLKQFSSLDGQLLNQRLLERLCKMWREAGTDNGLGLLRALFRHERTLPPDAVWNWQFASSGSGGCYQP
jgi:hypothetical protein